MNTNQELQHHHSEKDLDQFLDQDSGQDSDQEHEQEINSDIQTPVSELPLIDKISLEYMTNRNQYKRYLDSTDESTGIFTPEMQKRIDDYMKYQDPAREIFSDLLQDFVLSGSVSKKYNQEIQILFQNFMDAIVHYLDKTLSRDSLADIHFDEFEADEDVLFASPTVTKPRFGASSKQSNKYERDCELNQGHTRGTVSNSIKSFFSRK